LSKAHYEYKPIASRDVSFHIICHITLSEKRQVYASKLIHSFAPRRALQESGKPTINREKAIRNRSRRCEDGTFNFSNIAIMMTATRIPIAKSIPKGIVASQRSEKNSKRKDPRTSQMISAGITMRQRII